MGAGALTVAHPEYVRHPFLAEVRSENAIVMGEPESIYAGRVPLVDPELWLRSKGLMGSIRFSRRPASSMPRGGRNLDDHIGSAQRDWMYFLQGASSLQTTWEPLFLLQPLEGGWPERGGTAGEAPATPWLSSVVERLEALLQLPPNWDGFGGAQVSPELAMKALDFLFRVVHPTTAVPAIAPLNDGGLQLDWHRGALDVEVMLSNGPNAGLYYLDLSTGQEFEGPIDAGIEGLRRLMDRLEGDPVTTTHVAA